MEMRKHLTRFGSALQRPPFPTFALALFGVAALLVLSFYLDAEASERVFHPLQLNPLVASVILFVAGGICGILLSALAQSGWTESASCFIVSIKGSIVWLWLVASLFVGVCTWFFSLWASSPENKHYLSRHDPGALFAGVMGLITVIGFAFTLHDLREMRRRITTFPDLIDRLTTMLSNKGEDNIRFLAYTPALGFIALEDSEFRTFADAMHGSGAKDMPHVDMTCLSPRGLRDWHDLFKGRKTRRKRFGTSPGMKNAKPGTPGEVDQQLADAATTMSEYIVDDLNKKASMSEDRAPVKRLPFEFLPGYYFFVSSSRAIVVAPLQLPFPKGAPKDAQQAHRTVQMLGFETNDRAIIHELADLYDAYKKLPSSYVAECSEVMPADGFDEWCGKPESWQASIQTLRRQFEIASGKVAADVGDAPEIQRHEDYGKYFDVKNLKNTTLEVMLRVSLKGASD